MMQLPLAAYLCTRLGIIPQVSPRDHAHIVKLKPLSGINTHPTCSISLGSEAQSCDLVMSEVTQALSGSASYGLPHPLCIGT